MFWGANFNVSPKVIGMMKIVSIKVIGMVQIDGKLLYDGGKQILRKRLKEMLSYLDIWFLIKMFYIVSFREIKFLHGQKAMHEKKCYVCLYLNRNIPVKDI